MTRLGPPTGVTHPDPGVGTDGAVIPPGGPRTLLDEAALRATGGTAAEAGPVTGSLGGCRLVGRPGPGAVDSGPATSRQAGADLRGAAVIRQVVFTLQRADHERARHPHDSASGAIDGG